MRRHVDSADLPVAVTMLRCVRRLHPDIHLPSPTSRTDVLAGLTTYELASGLRTQPLVGEQGEEVGHADVAVAVEVAGAVFARTPTCQQREEIGYTDAFVGVEVPGAKSNGSSIKEVCRTGVEAVVVVQQCPDDGGRSADRGGVAELVVRYAIVG